MTRNGREDTQPTAHGSQQQRPGGCGAVLGVCSGSEAGAKHHDGAEDAVSRAGLWYEPAQAAGMVPEQLPRVWGSPEGESRGAGRAASRVLQPESQQRAAGPHGPSWPQLPLQPHRWHGHTQPTPLGGAPTGTLLLASTGTRGCTRVPCPCRTGCGDAQPQSARAVPAGCHAEGWRHCSLFLGQLLRVTAGA